MKKFFKFLGYTLLVLIVIIAGLLTYIKVALPNVGAAQNLTVDLSPEKN